jgi:hypothetical protein
MEKPMLKLILPIVVLAAVSGCSLAPFGDKVKVAVDTAIDTGIEDRKAYNDKKAGTLLELPCDISVGAYYRMQNSVQQEALTMLCSGKRPAEPNPPLALTGVEP